jgi:hypothetical protein
MFSFIGGVPQAQRKAEIWPVRSIKTTAELGPPLGAAKAEDGFGKGEG